MYKNVQNIKKFESCDIISSDEIMTIAKQTGFFQRSGKIIPFDFLMTLIFRLVVSVPPGLRLIASLLNKTISRSGLHQRFTAQAALFIQKCLQIMILKQLINSQPIATELIDPFNRVLIIDSSSWDVSSHMKTIFTGSGGSASEGNCKLQFCYDFKGGSIILFEVTKGTEPDQSYSKKIPLTIPIQEKDLFIFDLGYWVIETLFQINQCKAYYVARFYCPANLWENKDGEYIPLRIEKILEKYSSTSAIEFNAFLKHHDTYLPIRMIAFRTPEEVSNIRRRKLIAQARKKGRTPSQIALELCYWSIFMTNASELLIPSKMIRTIYRLRWSIELIFKDWKSILKMHRSNVKKNHHRFLCELYAKLILAVIVKSLHQRLHVYFWSTYKKEISLNCLWKYINAKLESLHEALKISVEKFLISINSAIPIILKMCEKYHQPSRKTSLQRIEEMIADDAPIKIELCDIKNA